MSRRGRGRSCLLVVVLLMLGILPGIIYLMWPRRDESALLTRIDGDQTEVVGEDWTVSSWLGSLSLSTRLWMILGVVLVFALLIALTE